MKSISMVRHPDWFHYSGFKLNFSVMMSITKKITHLLTSKAASTVRDEEIYLLVNLD